ncbi:hypothetical protein HU720_21635 [Pseudomonas sp. SWRI51]|uniref:KGGVGR-motif variant AAA ATPase n=1 Tax=Pseudomonas sp. SWRI51 TaxID=2745491 RepID=UPI00164881D2|nr:hypothetical protein [Pseudomonas sp. SWRI51]MBC3413902.1 hypothetical protein [Pseudomonas sp. SWRI51]
MESTIRYDEALPSLASAVIDVMGDDFLKRNLILRDADGLLTFVIREVVESSQKHSLSVEILNRIGVYGANPIVATPDELYDPRLADPNKDEWELVTLKTGQSFYTRYIERRIVGSDWVRGIFPTIVDAPPVVVFASHKGGVGRSTALTVASKKFADAGKSILAIDLDLEAPGIGGMLLENHEIPLYGAIDYYVECGRGRVGDDFIASMVAESTAERWPGKITIVPAAGAACRRNPQNVLGKISRAYLETDSFGGDGQGSFLDKTRELIKDLSRCGRYDVIFIDARAGLNESTAATIQGLGADILFFGVDTPQTWEGYRYFLSHLARFKSTATQESDWRYKLKMVHAKAIDSHDSLIGFRDRSFELFAEHIYDEIGEDESAQGLVDAFGFDLDDQSAPHYAWPIFMDEAYYEFNPGENAEQFGEEQVERAFGEFINNLSERLGIS